MVKKKAIKNIQPNTQITIYKTNDGKARVEVRFENENAWLTQAQMSELFDRDQSVISKHIKNVISEGELDEKSSMQNLHTAISDKPVVLYSLDVIISVGYRVKSLRGTQFRIWATEHLKEYMIKGFTMDDIRLKQGGYRSRYFEELLQRIRDIRSSERMLYQKVTDIYSTAIDYRKDAKETDLFFKTVQNKMHFAVTGKTAAEIITQRASHTKQNMGLTNFPGIDPIKRDIFIAKNYLERKELELLNRIVDAYLSFAEIQAQNEKAMRMTDWIKKLDEYLSLLGKGVLKHSGSVSTVDAEMKAEAEFVKFKKEESKKYISDFDKMSKKMLGKAKK